MYGSDMQITYMNNIDIVVFRIKNCILYGQWTYVVLSSLTSRNKMFDLSRVIINDTLEKWVVLFSNSGTKIEYLN